MTPSTPMARMYSNMFLRLLSALILTFLISRSYPANSSPGSLSYKLTGSRRAHSLRSSIRSLIDSLCSPRLHPHTQLMSNINHRLINESDPTFLARIDNFHRGFTRSHSWRNIICSNRMGGSDDSLGDCFTLEIVNVEAS